MMGALLWIGLAGCTDPVAADRIADLPPDPSGREGGPLHRPGQPCLLCHGRDSNPLSGGPHNFVQAGTVFKYRDSPEPLAGAVVRLVDSEGAEIDLVSNCAGTFWVTGRDFDPVYPVWTDVRFGVVSVPMKTPVFREDSCADCHSDPPGPASAGRVFFTTSPTNFPPGGCR